MRYCYSSFLLSQLKTCTTALSIIGTMQTKSLHNAAYSPCFGEAPSVSYWAMLAHSVSTSFTRSQSGQIERSEDACLLFDLRGTQYGST